MADLPDELRHALAKRLTGTPPDALRAAVARLMSAYRAGSGLGSAGKDAVPPRPDSAGSSVAARSGGRGGSAVPILTGQAEIAAYAAYRMPATYAALRSVFAALPSLSPASLLDVGGGTGAAAWAATDVYPSVTRIVVLDRVDGALRLGASLAAAASSEALRHATWQHALLPAELPVADLVTVSYVLGELTDAAREDVVERAGRAGRAVVIVEPGTPAGYRRILAARDRLLALGHLVVAPCPHQSRCPLAAGDWCHFGARVNRSALHRRIKDADLPYEDEKFSYVATVSPAEGVPRSTDAAETDAAEIDAAEIDAAEIDGAETDAAETDAAETDAAETDDVPVAGAARVIRRPARRKGMVSLRLCAPDGAAIDRVVTKRDPAAYRLARDTSWGDTFPV